MIDLFKAELMRFRWWAAGCAALQLVVLGFLTRVVDLAQQPLLVYRVFAAVYAAAGLLLGLLPDRRDIAGPTPWLNLLHRPLAPSRIAIALLGAGAALLAAGRVVALARHRGVAGEHDRARRRHAAPAVDRFGWIVSVCGYLTGAYLMLADKRQGYCAAVFLLLIVFSQATGFGAIAIQGLSFAWLLAMVLVAFKPDLGTPARGATRTLITAAPMTMMMWFALVMVGFGVEFLWIAQGSHPNNVAVPNVDGEKEIEVLDGKDLFVKGLRSSTDPEAPLWREQAAIADIDGLFPGLARRPHGNQLTNIAPMEFDDTERRVRWVFSHDTMHFEGYSLVDKRAVGTLGMAGDAPFPAPVLPVGDKLLVDRSTVYQYDQDANLVLPRARLPDGEAITGYGKAGDDFVLVGERALYFFDGRALDGSDGLLTPRLRVPVPGRIGDIQRIDAMELLDGWLLSVLLRALVVQRRGRRALAADRARVRRRAQRDRRAPQDRARLSAGVALPGLVPVAGALHGAEGSEERLRRCDGAAADGACAGAARDADPRRRS
jgi:hypothetical protein